VADRYGTDHHELVVRPDMLDVLPRLAWYLDEPMADPSALPTYYVSQMARQHVTVVLNGDGGDERFWRVLASWSFPGSAESFTGPGLA